MNGLAVLNLSVSMYRFDSCTRHTESHRVRGQLLLYSVCGRGVTAACSLTMKVTHWTVNISDTEYEMLLREASKEYVAGYLMGRLIPQFSVANEKEIEKEDLE